MGEYINLEEYGFKSYKKENIEEIEKALEGLSADEDCLPISVDFINEIGRNSENLYVYCSQDNINAILTNNTRIYFDGKFIYDLEAVVVVFLSEEKKEIYKNRFFRMEKIFYESLEKGFMKDDMAFHCITL